ncbi:MAG: hypothetical protein APF76_10295 [Desulfitibacter sp. BRH_c19]|nr:MAG: hypothetical protein APF76_10295 [Desulfitibacter sp. BRH_c19]
MHEFLENLYPKFDKVFKNSVKMTEVTVFSLQLTTKCALIMTNKSIYLLKKSFFGGVKAINFPLNKIELKVTGNELKIIADQYDANIKILDNRKVSLLNMALEKFIQFKNKPQI